MLKVLIIGENGQLGKTFKKYLHFLKDFKVDFVGREEINFLQKGMFL